MRRRRGLGAQLCIQIYLNSEPKRKSDMIALKRLVSIFAIFNTSLAWVPAPKDSTKRIDASVVLAVKQQQQQGAAKKIGFLGCGTIASAIARGIATQTDIPIASIAVTKRSENKSAQLQHDFPSLVTIYEGNQEILDTSDLVFLCVLPQLTNQVLEGVIFDESRHNLISLVSTAKLVDLVRDSKLPASKVSKLLCLPSISRHQGVSLYCSTTPPNSIIVQLLQAMGGVVNCETEDQLSACMISTVYMGPLYGTMRRNRDWLMDRGGLSLKDASRLVIQQYSGMIQDAVQGADDGNAAILDELIAEQTRGGLNEQALTNLNKLGAIEAYDRVMDSILSRIQGNSDGSL